MRIAFEEAQNAMDSGEVPVGCVFVRNGEILARDHNRTGETRNATRHCEMVCMD